MMPEKTVELNNGKTVKYTRQDDQCVGSGEYGEVYIGKMNPADEYVAIKFMGYNEDYEI